MKSSKDLPITSNITCMYLSYLITLETLSTLKILNILIELIADPPPPNTKCSIKLKMTIAVSKIFILSLMYSRIPKPNILSDISTVKMQVKAILNSSKFLLFLSARPSRERMTVLVITESIIKDSNHLLSAKFLTYRRSASNNPKAPPSHISNSQLFQLYDMRILSKRTRDLQSLRKQFRLTCCITSSPLQSMLRCETLNSSSSMSNHFSMCQLYSFLRFFGGYSSCVSSTISF